MASLNVGREEDILSLWSKGGVIIRIDPLCCLRLCNGAGDTDTLLLVICSKLGYPYLPQSLLHSNERSYSSDKRVQQ